MISRAHATASHANAGRLRSQAGSQVVRVTVVLHTVDVVNRLPFEQVAAENGFHDQYVLEHMGSPGRRARMARDAAHHIARLVHSAKPRQSERFLKTIDVFPPHAPACYEELLVRSSAVNPAM